MDAWQITGPPPVEHRVLGLDRRYLPGALAVLFLVVFWAVIVPAIDDSFGEEAIPAGTVLEIGRTGVRFTPTPGWTIAGVPLPVDQGMTIFDEGMTFEVRVGAFRGTPLELLTQIRDVHRDFTVEGSVRSVTLPQGAVGSAVQIFSTSASGALFAFVHGSNGIQVIAQGPAEVLPQHTREIGLMVASLRFDQNRGAQ